MASYEEWMDNYYESFVAPSNEDMTLAFWQDTYDYIDSFLAVGEE